MAASPDSSGSVAAPIPEQRAVELTAAFDGLIAQLHLLEKHMEAMERRLLLWTAAIVFVDSHFKALMIFIARVLYALS